MDKKINLKKILSANFFEFPKSRFTNSRIARKFFFFNSKHEIKSPAVYICNKTMPYDKFLIASALFGNFVFLNDDVILKLHRNTLSKQEKTELLSEIKLLVDNGYSLVVFPEKNYTIFGECERLPQSVTEFLFETKLDLRFFYLIGTYFAKPVWSNQVRKCETRYSQQFRISHTELAEKSVENRNNAINNLMPSSASIYAQKFSLLIKNESRAENIDSIVYCCPKCKSFFSIYSEFSCLKCRNCGSFIEFSNDGKIMFSNEIESFDDIEPFLFNTLKKYNFTIKAIVTYDNIKLIKETEDGKPEIFKDVNLEIYADKFVFVANDKKRTFNISEVEELALEQNNTLFVKAKKEEFRLQGEHKENLFILIHLLKLYRQN